MDHQRRWRGGAGPRGLKAHGEGDGIGLVGGHGDPLLDAIGRHQPHPGIDRQRARLHRDDHRDRRQRRRGGLEHRSRLLVEAPAGEELGPEPAGARQGVGLARAGDLGVVSAKQDLGDAVSIELGGPGVLGVLEEPRREAVVLDGGLVAHRSREQTDHAVDDGQRRDLPPRHDEVAQRDLLIGEAPGALIETLVAARHQDQMRHRGIAREISLRQRPSLRREHHDVPAAGAPAPGVFDGAP